MDDAPLPGSRPTLAGNVPDPDAAVLDSLVEQHAEPPTPAQLPRDVARPTAAPKRPTRLLTGTTALLATWEPLLLLPADAARTALRIRVSSDVPTDVVRVGDDAGKLQTDGSAYTALAGETVVLDDVHTGPVWIYAPNATGVVAVTYAAVTA